MLKWSSEQEDALKSVDHWFKNERTNQQIFRLFGFAGSGKTTLAKHFAQNIDGTVKFATFTGKAAHVMAQKGCTGASTIHKLIYRPKIASKEHLKRLEERLQQTPATKENEEIIKKLRSEIKLEQQNAGRMSFSLNMESEIRGARLLIVDEVSMVSADIGKDLESFGVPILVLGDPEQLPPIYGAGYFTEQNPDIMLHDIHRQALDNPIIAMSKMVREGEHLPLGDYGSSKVVAYKMESNEVMEHDMILTGLRKTKRACDTRVRNILQRGSTLPVKGDSVMCVKNNHNLGLLNGQIWECMSDAVPMGGTVSLHIRNIDSDIELAVHATEKLFHGQPLARWEHEDGVEEFEYAYAITVHKAQGSQWDNVLLFDQKDCFPVWSDRDKRRWLYTGLTRAAQRVTVMRL